MKPVQVVGLGLNPQDLSAQAMAEIEKAKVLAGGGRLLNYFPRHPGKRIVLRGGLKPWLEQVSQAADEGVVVLASGDPGFFGIAARLVEKMGPENVEIHPNLTAMQIAFARLKESWQDAGMVSLHGREEESLRGLWSTLSQYDKVIIYTDPFYSPSRIAGLLRQRGQDFWRMIVLENLGGDDEKRADYSLDQVPDRDFSPLNLVVLKRTSRPRPLHLGMPEDAYEHQDGIITKAEVRCAALGKLALEPGQTLWDLGAGCGSVGIEATLLTPGGLVVAVEQNPERVKLIKANRARFGAAALEVVQGRMPQCLADLPDPDRVFLGGGGDGLEEIARAAIGRLPPSGILVVSAVRLKSLDAARQVMMQAGMKVEETLVHISRGTPLSGDVMLKGLNPVWLIRGQKPRAGQNE
ncbi:MAG: precorrin-6y C5,15-methyltransferase (decarboxylating) subunit CbiE [Desulfarculaceae bacterium]|jgi:precorrin-6Y C5,15-methyltransferase (decarboxylating)